jgi:hypothetical protein
MDMVAPEFGSVSDFLGSEAEQALHVRADVARLEAIERHAID